MFYHARKKKSKSYFFAIYFTNAVSQTFFSEMYLQKTMLDTFDRLGIAEFCAKREIIHAITKPKEIYKQ